MSTDPASLQNDLNIRRLLLVRVATGTALLLPVLYLQFLGDTSDSLAPVYGLIGALYGTSLLYTLAQRVAGAWPGFAAFQLTVDTVIATTLVYALGGVRSPFVLVYLIIALGAGVMTQPQMALAIGVWIGVAYGLMAHLAAAAWLPHWEVALGPRSTVVGPPEMYLRIFVVLFASCVVAAVSSSTSTKLRSTRRQLRQERSALEAVQQLNQQLLSGMSGGLIAADAEGNIVACNRAAERITERPKDEIVGHSLEAILGLDGAARAALDEQLSERQVYRTERRIESPSGQARMVGMSITRVTELPVAGGYIFMFQDLTDVKRMERLFWMRERMAVLGEMASSLAHEIRNPLGSISGSLQMLRRGDVTMASESGGRLMDIVTSESERLSRIIEDFLDYARPEKLDAGDNDLAALARDTVALLRNSPELRDDHTLEVVADGEAITALVDAARIKQVFWNLARNAVEAMPEGGVLRIKLGSTPGGARVVFEDSGTGMDAEQVDKAFLPFVSDTDAGTGLGLAVVYRIMQLHGARIEVQSELGKGTRFVLKFEDSMVPGPDDSTVVVEGRTERETRLFDELSRAIRTD